MVDVGRREDRMLDVISAQKAKITEALSIIEEAMIAKLSDAVLDQLWFALK